MNIEKSVGSNSGENKTIFIISLLILGAVFLCFAWPSISLLSVIYETEDDYSHGFLVPLISIWATYEIWQGYNGRSLKPSWFGVPVFLIGVMTVISGYWYYISLNPAGLGYGFVLALGFMFCVTGGYIIYGGFPTLRIFFFPIVYLIFTIPFPKSLTLPLTLWLRSQVSAISEVVIRKVGITIFREGNVLHLVNASLGVEDACSGIRSFWMLMAGGAALGFVLNIGLRRSVFLCLAALPISIVMNVLRVVVTGVLVRNFGVHYASGWRHEACGWFTFAAGLALLMGTGSLLARKQRNLDEITEDRDSQSAQSDEGRKRGLFPVPKPAMLLVVFTLTAFAAPSSYIINRHYESADVTSFENRRELSEFPEVIGGYQKISDGALYESHLNLLAPTDYLIRYYQNSSGQRIELRVIYWNPLKYRRSERRHGLDDHIPDVCYPAWGFKRINEYDLVSQVDGIPAEVVNIRRFQKSGNEECVLFWYEGEGSLLQHGDLFKRLGYMVDSWNEPFLKHGTQYVISVVVKTERSYEDARDTAIEFARLISPVLPEYGID